MSQSFGGISPSESTKVKLTEKKKNHSLICNYNSLNSFIVLYEQFGDKLKSNHSKLRKQMNVICRTMQMPEDPS